jgi:hypothetical protein
MILRVRRRGRVTPEQAELDKIFDEIWENQNWCEADETEKQLSRMTVEDLLRPFTV